MLVKFRSSWSEYWKLLQLSGYLKRILKCNHERKDFFVEWFYSNTTPAVQTVLRLWSEKKKLRNACTNSTYMNIGTGLGLFNRWAIHNQWLSISDKIWRIPRQMRYGFCPPRSLCSPCSQVSVSSVSCLLSKVWCRLMCALAHCYFLLVSSH